MGRGATFIQGCLKAKEPPAQPGQAEPELCTAKEVAPGAKVDPALAGGRGQREAEEVLQRRLNLGRMPQKAGGGVVGYSWVSVHSRVLVHGWVLVHRLVNSWVSVHRLVLVHGLVSVHGRVLVPSPLHPLLPLLAGGDTDAALVTIPGGAWVGVPGQRLALGPAAGPGEVPSSHLLGPG